MREGYVEFEELSVTQQRLCSSLLALHKAVVRAKSRMELAVIPKKPYMVRVLKLLEKKGIRGISKTGIWSLWKQNGATAPSFNEVMKATEKKLPPKTVKMLRQTYSRKMKQRTKTRKPELRIDILL